MKLLLLIMLTTFSIASTQYKTPVFVVEKSTLYCFNERANLIEEFIPGDLVSGDYAAHKCSYNKETVQKKYYETGKENETVKNKKEEFGVGSFLLLFCFMALIFMCLPQDHKVKDEYEEYKK